MPTWPPSTPGSVKSLRQYWKNKDVTRSPQSIIAELQGESDRAIIILAASVLDDMLSYVLARRMIFVPTDDQMEYIFRPDGPVGTFSGKIELAYLFGFIEDNTRSQLNDLRELRNACAHSHQEISLENAALANVAKRLLYPCGFIKLAGETRQELREAFLQEFIILIRALGAGSRAKGIALVQEDLKTAFASIGQPPSLGKPPQP
jgi:hypothetical protein